MRKAGRGWSELQGDLREIRELAQWLRDLIDRSGLTVRKLEEQLPMGRDKISKSLNGSHRPAWELVKGVVTCCSDAQLLERRLGEARTRWIRADPSTATRVTPARAAARATYPTSAADSEIGVYQQLVKALEQQSALERQLGESNNMVLTLRLMVSQLEQRIDDLTRERDALLQTHLGATRIENTEKRLVVAVRQHERAEIALKLARAERDEAERLRVLAEERARRLQTELEDFERADRVTQVEALTPADLNQPVSRTVLDQADDVDRALDTADHVLASHADELARIADALEETAPALADQLRVVVGHVVDPGDLSDTDNSLSSDDMQDNQAHQTSVASAVHNPSANPVSAKQPFRPGTEAHAAARLRALTGFAKSMAAAHSVEDVIRIAVREAQRDLRAAVASISMWERQTGRLRVLANHGELAAGESPFPKDDSYPVSDFPELLLGEDDLEPWIQVADDEYGDPKRVSMLRRRGRHCALIAPIVYNGRAWGELFAARTIDQPLYDREDVDFAAALTAQVAANLLKADKLRSVERLAYTDDLTGVANRRSFDVRLDAAIDRHASGGTVVSLIVCDVNGVERMIEEYGRGHGDALLVQLAGVMSAAAALLPGSLAARLDVDRFCVLIEGYGADDAVRVAEELCNLALTVRGGEGVACGVASTGDRIGDVITRDRLFHLANAARDRAKRSRSLHPVVAGRGQPPDATIFDPAAPPTLDTPTSDRRHYRGRNGISVESLLIEAFSALDEEAKRATPAVPTVDRVEVVADVVARGLGAASWYIYSKPNAAESISVVRYSVYRTPTAPDPTGDGLLSAAQPVSPDHFTGIKDVLRSSEYTELSDSRFDSEPGNSYAADLPPGAAKLAAAGYTGALTIGSSAPDRSQWMVAVLLDSNSKPPTSAVPLLRALLAAALS